MLLKGNEKLMSITKPNDKLLHAAAVVLYLKTEIKIWYLYKRVGIFYTKKWIDMEWKMDTWLITIQNMD